MFLKPVGIQKRTVTTILGTALLAFVFFGVGLFAYRDSLMQTRAEEFLSPYAGLIAVSVAPAVDQADRVRASKILQSLHLNSQILRADIFLPGGGTLTTYPTNQPALDKNAGSRPDGVFLGAGTAELIRSFSVSDAKPARIFLRMSLATLQHHDRQRLQDLALVVALVLCVIALLQYLLLRRWVLSPLAELAGIAERAGQKGDYSQRMPAHERDEFGQLGKSFNALLAAVEQREAALRELTNFQSAILNDAAYAIISTDTNGIITSVNPAGEKLMGWRADELVGKATPAIFHLPEEVAARAAKLSDQLGETIQPGFESFVAEARRGKRSETEWPCVRKDGSRLPVLLSVTALRDERGEIFGFLGIAQDITERKQVEATLREALEFNQRLVSASQIGINVYAADGACVLTNAAAARIIGTAVEKMTEINFRRIASWQNSGLLATAELVLADGQTRQLEAHLVTSYGKEIWLDCTFSRFHSGGKPHLLHILNDITARKTAEQSLVESRRLYENLVFSVPLGVYRVIAHEDKDVLEFVSDRFCELTGLTREAVLADESQVLAIIHAQDQPAFIEANQLAYERRAKFFWEGRATVRGHVRWLHIESHPTEVPGRPPFWTGVVSDVTERRDIEEALRQQHSLLVGTLQATADGILAVSSDGHITSYNRQFLELWRVPKEILDHHNTAALAEYILQQLRNPAAMQTRIRTFNDTSKADTFDTLEFTDGRVFERFSRPQLVAGCVVGRVWSFRDVTARHWAVAALRESEQKFKTLFETALDGILLMNEHVFLECNLKSEALYGCAREKIVGQSPVQFSPERQADGQLSADKAAEKIRAALAGTPQFFEWIHCRENGTLFNAEISLNRLELRGQRLIQVIVRDITARKEIEVARLEAEELYRTLVNTSPDGICVLDLEGRITFSSPKDVELFRLSSVENKLGRNGLDFVAEADRERAAQAIGETQAGKFNSGQRFKMLRGDGTEFVAELNGTPLRDALGLPHGTMFVIRDVTDRQRQEDELKSKNVELERFTYTVSHDLKSPLITIKGFANALLADAAAGRADRLTDDLKRIVMASDKMSDLLNGLLELSRIGRIINPPTDVSMNQLIEEVIALLAGPIAQRQAKVTVQTALPDTVGDAQRLQEVLQNLLENALKFSVSGRDPQIEIGCKMQCDPPVYFVRDNGRGIEARFRETIFSLFNKLDARSEGAGIGLALVRRIVEFHGGTVWAESAGLDQGTTFYFTLPAHRAPSTATTTTS